QLPNAALTAYLRRQGCLPFCSTWPRRPLQDPCTIGWSRDRCRAASALCIRLSAQRPILTPPIHATLMMCSRLSRRRRRRVPPRRGGVPVQPTAISQGRYVAHIRKSLNVSAEGLRCRFKPVTLSQIQLGAETQGKGRLHLGSLGITELPFL